MVNSELSLAVCNTAVSGHCLENPYWLHMVDINATEDLICTLLASAQQLNGSELLDDSQHFLVFMDRCSCW